MSLVPLIPTQESPSYKEQPRILEASFSQQRLWFLDRLLPGIAAYNVPLAFRLSGELNAGILEKSLAEIIRRHEILRTTFTTDQDRPCQVISPFVSFSLPVVAMDDADLDRTLTDETRQPFDLQLGPLFRAKLFRIDPMTHVLLMTMHHIVTDGWSLGVLVLELSALYKAYAAGLPSPIPDLTFQYADFTRWQREQLNGKLLETQLSFWKNHIGDTHSLLPLPSDRPRPEIATYNGKCLCFKLPAALCEALISLARKNQATLYMVLLAGFYVLLHRYTGSKQIVVGSPIANRSRVEIEPLIGFFVNTLALRADVNPDETFNGLLSQVRNAALAAYTHQDLPFEKLVEEIQPERTLSYNPIFQVSFGLHRPQLRSIDFPGIESEELFVDRESVPFDLNIAVTPEHPDFLIEAEYSTDLFDADRITRMIGHYTTLLEGIVENPQEQIGRLPLLTEYERTQVLVDWNRTESDYPGSLTIHEVFEKQVSETPDAIAILFAGQQITYRQLSQLSNRLAAELQKDGVKPGEIIGLYTERSIEMIVGLLAILKTGGAYLPLDPALPVERFLLLASDSGVRRILSHHSKTPITKELPVSMFPIDLNSLQDKQAVLPEPLSNADSDRICYVMYTSGSTGTPKGVCVPHKAVLRLVKGSNYIHLGPEEILFQYAPLSFDASTFEIWGALLNGARLVIPPPEILTLTDLGKQLKANHVTTLWLTSVLFNEMVDQRIEDLSGLRQLLAGGDILSVSHVRKALSHLKNCRLINGYGPTEGTTFTLCHPIKKVDESEKSIPIGRPISNTRVYILDEFLQPLPIGIPGELYIGGDGVAKGYLNQPERTAEKFIADPFSHKSGALLYKTGDLCRWNVQGEIEFIGRTDDQVKIRGFRIEPAEIDAALRRHPHVTQTFILPHQSGQNDRQLIAYIVTKEQLSRNEIRDFLEKQLPSYMIPAHYFFLSELPLNANGKIDRDALPLPDSSTDPRDGQKAGPENYLESQMIRIWQKVLNQPSIGVQDNFFDLGGHSLLALKLFGEIEKEIGKNLPLVTLLTAQSIRSLSRVILQEGYDHGWASLVPIQSKGSNPPLFLCHGIGGTVLNYRLLSKYLGTDQPLYGLQSQGLDGKTLPLNRLEDMARLYIREMQTVQPKGPYHLGGGSFGGVVAFEMAQQLLAQGEEVALVALFDSIPPWHGSVPLRTEIQFLRKRAALHLNNLLVVRKRAKYVRKKIQTLKRRFKTRLWTAAYTGLSKVNQPMPKRFQNVKEMNTLAYRNYVPKFYSGSLDLFLAEEIALVKGDVPTMWRALAKNVVVTRVPGDHTSLVMEPNVQVLVKKLKQLLNGHAAEQTG